MTQRVGQSAKFSEASSDLSSHLELQLDLPVPGLRLAQESSSGQTLVPVPTSAPAQDLSNRFTPTQIQTMVSRAMYLWHGTNQSQAIASQLQVEYKLTAPQVKEIMRRAVQQRTAYAQPIETLRRQFRQTGTLNTTELEQLQHQLARNPSPNDTTLFNQLIQTVRHLRATGKLDIGVGKRIHLMLLDLGILVWAMQGDGTPDMPTSAQPPANAIHRVNPRLTRWFNRAGVHNQRVTVAVADVTGFFPDHPATVLRTNDQTAGQSEAAVHGLAVSSRITAGNLQLNTVYLRWRTAWSDGSLQTAINSGARLVNVSAGPKSAQDDSRTDRKLITANPDVLFVIALRNDRDAVGDYEAYSAGLYGLPNVLIVANAVNADSMNPGSQQGRRVATHAAIGTNVAVAEHNARVGRGSGNSLVAPEIVKVIGLMWVANPALTVAQVRAILELTTTKSNGLRDAVDSGGLVPEEDAVVTALLTGLVRRGLSYADAIATLKLDPDTAARLQPVALTIEVQRSGRLANQWTLQSIGRQYGLTGEELSWLQNASGLAPTSINTLTSLAPEPKPGLAERVLKKLGTQDPSTLPAWFSRQRVQAITHRAYNAVLAQMQEKFNLTPAELAVLKNIVLDHMSADRAMEKAGGRYVLNRLRYKLNIPHTTQSPHFENQLNAIFTRSLADDPSQTDAPAAQSVTATDALSLSDSAVQPQKNPEDVAAESRSPQSNLNPPAEEPDKTSGGWIQRPDKYPERAAGDFVRRDLPLGDNPDKGIPIRPTPKVETPKGGLQLPKFPGSGFDLSGFGKGLLVFPKKLPEKGKPLFDPRQTPAFPRANDRDGQLPTAKKPLQPATTPDTVALALSLLTQAPKGGAATLIQTWSQALSQRQHTPGAEMLKTLLGSRFGLEQVLDYGYGGTVLQALSRVDDRLVPNYLNVTMLKKIATDTRKPTLAKSATALLQSVARLASKRVQVPAPPTSPAAAAHTLAQLQQQLARLQRQLTSGADAKAWQKNLHELQKNLRTFWVQIAPIIKAASAAHQNQLAQAIEVVQQKLNEVLQYAEDPQGLGRDAQTAGQGLLAVVGIALGFAWDAFTNISVLKKESI